MLVNKSILATDSDCPIHRNKVLLYFFFFPVKKSLWNPTYGDSLAVAGSSFFGVSFLAVAASFFPLAAAAGVVFSGSFLAGTASLLKTVQQVIIQLLFNCHQMWQCMSYSNFYQCSLPFWFIPFTWTATYSVKQIRRVFEDHLGIVFVFFSIKTYVGGTLKKDNKQCLLHPHTPSTPLPHSNGQ